MKLTKLNPVRINLNEEACVRALASGKGSNKGMFKLNVNAAKLLDVKAGDYLDAYVNEDNQVILVSKGSQIKLGKVGDKNSDGMLFGSSTVVTSNLKKGQNFDKINVFSAEPIYFDQDMELVENVEEEDKENLIAGIILTYKEDEDKLEREFKTAPGRQKKNDIANDIED